MIQQLRMHAQKGFTLVEMLAVLLIIGAIAAISIPMVQNAIDNSRVRADQTTEKQILEASLRYIADYENSKGVYANGATVTILIREELANRSYLRVYPKSVRGGLNYRAIALYRWGGEWVPLNPASARPATVTSETRIGATPTTITGGVWGKAGLVGNQFYLTTN